MSAVTHAHWQNHPERRARASARTRLQWQDDKYYAHMRKSTIAQWKKPQRHARMRAALLRWWQAKRAMATVVRQANG